MSDAPKQVWIAHESWIEDGDWIPVCVFDSEQDADRFIDDLNEIAYEERAKYEALLRDEVDDIDRFPDLSTHHVTGPYPFHTTDLLREEDE